MPLSDHEQRILEEIERRLSEEDPRLAEQVGRTSLYSHLAGRIRWAAAAFIVGFLLLFGVLVNVAVALVGFFVMLVSALLVYRYLKQMGREQLRSLQQSGRFSVTGLLARLAERFRGTPPASS